MSSVWKWVKIVIYFALGIGGMVVVFAIIQRRNNDKAKIDGRIEEIKKIEAKTDADLAELKRLEEEKRKAEQAIKDTSNVFLQKAKDLMSNKKPDKPGDAGTSADNLTDAWGGKK